jgi:hypothetical protein
MNSPACREFIIRSPVYCHPLLQRRHRQSSHGANGSSNCSQASAPERHFVISQQTSFQRGGHFSSDSQVLPNDDQFLTTISHLFVPDGFDLSDLLWIFQGPVVTRCVSPPLPARFCTDHAASLTSRSLPANCVTASQKYPLDRSIVDATSSFIQKS